MQTLGDKVTHPTIMGDEDALLTLRPVKHVFIRQPRRFHSDEADVMPLAPQSECDAFPDAFVQQKLHDKANR